ncbi:MULTISPECIES: alpha/beta fold hydrolase [unclassified Methanobrevibacter]|uniref:alpha/beta fold hydrolase n=1 Tax=unclassified Methanobrevibacter TaxID=2638681 RepID=UPI002733A129|nr:MULTISPECIES: alpha/beta fold hydrolase [unclassified Methanobrevibacter]
MVYNEVFIDYDKFIIDEFEFESGDILNDVDVEYLAKGTPKYDDDGNMTNAIVYCHSFNENYSSLDNLYRIIGEGKIFDYDSYYFIFATSLGFPNSCSPSVTNLKHNFPKYTIKDRVNFKRQFLKERFNIERVHGIMGRGLGGYEVYTWACEYPDEMDFIMISGSSYKTNGYRYVISKCMDSILDLSDDFYSDVYTDSLSRMMVSINRLLYSNYFSKRMFQKMSNDEIDVLMDDFVDEGLFVDVYDFKFRNDAILEYNLEDKLKNIKTNVLIVGTDNDVYYAPEFDLLPLEDLIENSKVVLFKSSDNYQEYDEHPIIDDELKEFLSNIK